MARRSRNDAATPEGGYPGVINQGYMAPYFLAYRLDSALEGLYEVWEKRERDGQSTPRSRVMALSKSFDQWRPDAAETSPEDGVEDHPIALSSLPASAVEALRELNDAVLTALGWFPSRHEVTLITGDAELHIPVAHSCSTASGLWLLALDSVFSTDPSAVMGGKNAPAGTLLAPVRQGDKVEARTALQAAQTIFSADNPPAYLLVCSGASITLLDRNRWGEGVYLGANIDDALARRDDRKKGELAAIAALFSEDAVNPGSNATSYLSSVLDRANNESVGVSKELRHGVRRSVELLAKAVVADMRTRQKVAWRTIDADELTRQSLRYIYRIIVLLFAEAQPKLGILPVNDSDYQAGYSLARLRDMALVELHSDQATTSTHIQQSLRVLFDLVNDGYRPELVMGDDVRGLEFPGLKSTLFGQSACPLLDRAEIGDGVLQQVLANLCFTKPERGRTRESLSYATLGINQLGAVYEGLMAYRGFLATEPLYEIDNDGNSDTGTWVIPIDKAAEFADELFVTEEGPDGQPKRVIYDEGDFVFRLAGRDRQRSASFYTPEVLTEFTVRHALDVYEEANPHMTAVDWLRMTICEPALGSGAFGNEAVNQLATRYLKAAQQERGETIDADTYQLEFQKAKAHFAINQTYGVDLNGTAVELAEVSFWLNCMHEGLQAPRFTSRLRRGNSLIGARRATYTDAQVAKAPWKGTSSSPAVPPTEYSLQDVPLGTAPGIHHFLLPGEGWGAAADAVELKGGKGVPGLAAEWSACVREWRKAVHAAPKPAQMKRLQALALRVEKAWADAASATAQHLRSRNQVVRVWGAPSDALPEDPNGASSASFIDPNGPTSRLRLLMDAWCALWMWAPANGTTLPSFEQWIDACELLLGQPDESDTGQLFTSYEVADGTLQSVELFGRARVEEVLDRHPWLIECRRVTEAQAFFHWELDFAPVFQRGGFDLQVGNPPWVRPTWDEPASLAEQDPWWGIVDLTKTPDATKRSRRKVTLTDLAASGSLAADRAEIEGVNALLASTTREPQLAGIQTNLYLNFMVNSWRRRSPAGVIGLVHPESHFIDPQAGVLRSEVYSRLRRHWQFDNKLFLFAEVHDNAVYAVHIYGGSQRPNFLQAANLLHPAIVDRSLAHDGTGELPSIQFPDGNWDLRPHARRVVRIDLSVLADWVGLFDEPGTAPVRSRLLRPLTEADLEALSKFARQPRRLGQEGRHWTSGFHEKGAKDDGTLVWETAIPLSLKDCILQGPHVTNATPFAQQPRSDLRSKNDWESLNLEALEVTFIPRTNYQRNVSNDEFVRRQTLWSGQPYTNHFREAHREFVDRAGARTLQSCIIPPGTAHLYTLNSIVIDGNRGTAILSALFASLPYDYLVKVFGASHLTQSVTDVIPLPQANIKVEKLVLLRILRLNCLTDAFEELWNTLFDRDWTDDQFEAGSGVVSLGNVTSKWSRDVPLRSDLDRWLALCEIDALVAILLGLTGEQLVQMYRSRCSVLRKNEFVTVFDGSGRRISNIHHNHGFHQAQWEFALKASPTKRGEKRVGMWERVQRYLGGETDVDLGPFKAPFVPADRELAMRTAYRAFQERLSNA